MKILESVEKMSKFNGVFLHFLGPFKQNEG